jgi:SAM-dependent methyltransferase
MAGKRYRPLQRYVLNVLLRPGDGTGWFAKFTTKLRNQLWNWMYKVFSTFEDDKFQFINYGYIPDDGKLIELKSNESAEDRFGHTCLQLYHEVANPVPIKGKNIVEVGCGRGGGAVYIANYLKPNMMTAIDLCAESVKFGNDVQKLKCPDKNLQFQVGNAMDLVDLKDGAYDVVVNVESSHCYPSFAKFIGEVYRILKPGGYFVTCDMRVAEHVKFWESGIADAGFTIKENVDITGNVLQSMRVCSASREDLMKAKFGMWYGFVRNFFRTFAGVEGTLMFDHYESRVVVYKRYVAQKPE